MTRVLIAGEPEMVRRGLESVVASAPLLEIVGSVDDLAKLGASILETEPDIVLISVESSLDEFLREATSAVVGDGLSQPPLVALVPESAASLSAAELRQGRIAALLPQDASVEEILAAINAAAAGLVVFHPAVMDLDRTEPRHFARTGPSPQLTARELEILRMLADGLGNKEIAWRLKISEHTVKFHLSSIFTKLDVSSRAEAVSLGFRLGLILT
ncbi:MAG: response regulator transcription factor [Terriglobia bacterium]